MAGKNDAETPKKYRGILATMGISAFFFGAISVGMLAVIFMHIDRYPTLALMISKAVNSLDDASEFNREKNVYLQGVFAPLEEENFNVPATIISGRFPDGFSGLFLQNGPNPITHHLDRGYHWFDGHGMIRSLRVKDGEAVYSNQWAQTPSYQLSRQYNQSVFMQLGELVGLSGILKAVVVNPLVLKAFGRSALDSTTANTAFLYYNNKLYLTHEGGYPFEIQWQPNNSFVSVGYDSMNNKLDFAFPAHTRKDPADGRVFFNGYMIDEAYPTYKFGSIHNGRVETYFPITGKVRSFAHDFVISENYAIIFESSVLFDKNGILDGNFFRFSSENNLRIGVIPKNATHEDQIRWFEADRPLSIIHLMQSWEEDNNILIYTPIGYYFNALDNKNSSLTNHFMFAEIKLNLIDGSVKINVFSEDDFVEFPNVHPKYVGRRAQFGYAGQYTPGLPGFQKIAKIDLFDKKFDRRIELPKNIIAQEPIVIPKTGKAGEASDNVFIAVFATNLTSNSAQWMLYDGETMSSEPIVHLNLGGKRNPSGFHCTWIPEVDLQQHMNL